jgi:hypothetical protein
MKSKIALLSLALASSVFALDEYLPLGPGILELDGGVSYVKPDGGDAAIALPLQAKYGVVPGLDIEIYTDLGVSGSTGLTPPQIAGKYAIGATGLAGFVNVVLPFAAGDFSDAGLGIAPGVVYGKNYGQIQAVGLASYQINIDDAVDDQLRIFLKPGYMFNDKAAGYVGLDYNKQGAANYTKLVPGVTYTLSSTLALEANLPIVVAENGPGKSWGIWASLYYTMPSM